jgi:carbonic anhydrase
LSIGIDWPYTAASRPVQKDAPRGAKGQECDRPAVYRVGQRDDYMTSADALQRLLDGNARFAAGASRQRPPGPERLRELEDGQHPFATVLGCSDSRVPPEMVFDEGLGELFVVRVAGNVVGPEILGSLGYALAHLETPLFVVLGHEGCGAVRAALEKRREGTAMHGPLAELIDAVSPALDDVDPRESPDAQLRQAVEANVRHTVRRLAATPAGRAALARDRIRLVGAVYELVTGRVRLLPEGGST